MCVAACAAAMAHCTAVAGADPPDPAPQPIVGPLAPGQVVRIGPTAGTGTPTRDYGIGATDLCEFMEFPTELLQVCGDSFAGQGVGFGGWFSPVALHVDRASVDSPDGVRYTGIDLVPSLVDKARELPAGVDFRTCDILAGGLAERFDYFVLSGALNYKVEDNMSLTRDMLGAMFELAGEGVAVNFLTSYVNYEHPRNFHHSPEAVFGLARSMTRWVTIRHDYPLWEFTLFMYKNQRGSSHAA